MRYFLRIAKALVKHGLKFAGKLAQVDLFVDFAVDVYSDLSEPDTEDAIRLLPEVIACHYISGSGTFELQVMATDLDAFSKFSLDTLLNLPHAKDIHTSFSLGEVKAGAALPLAHLRRERR